MSIPVTLASKEELKQKLKEERKRKREEKEEELKQKLKQERKQERKRKPQKDYTGVRNPVDYVYSHIPGFRDRWENYSGKKLDNNSINTFNGDPVNNKIEAYMLKDVEYDTRKPDYVREGFEPFGETDLYHPKMFDEGADLESSASTVSNPNEVNRINTFYGDPETNEIEIEDMLKGYDPDEIDYGKEGFESPPRESDYSKMFDEGADLESPAVSEEDELDELDELDEFDLELDKFEHDYNGGRRRTRKSKKSKKSKKSNKSKKSKKSRKSRKSKKSRKSRRRR
jgi:hypothetical protein